jgi:hypothetical protein
MDFWTRVAVHEARGLTRPVAMRAARISEAYWSEAQHLRNRVGEFRDIPGVITPRPRTSGTQVTVNAELLSAAANILEAVPTAHAAGLARDLRAAAGESIPTAPRRTFDLSTLGTASSD